MGEILSSARGSRSLINAAAFVVVVAGLKAAGSIAVLLLVSVFFAMISAPAVIWLRGKRVPAAIGVLLMVVAALGVFTVMGVLIGTSINGFVKALPVYRATLNDRMGDVLNRLGEAGLADYGLEQLKAVDPGAVMGVVGNIFTALGGLLGNSLVIILIVVFILLEVSSFPLKMRAAFGDEETSSGRFGRITADVGRYLGLKTVVSLITGVAIGLWVAVLGLDFPLLWGLLAFALNYIPTFGSLVAAVPAVLLALVQLGPGSAGLVALGFVLVNFVMGSVIEPRLMGQGLGLSTLVVFVSLLGWGWVLGTVGMFLAVPLTVALKIVLESNDDTRWIAVLMGPAREARQNTEPAS